MSCRGKSADLTGTGIKRQTDLIPRPRPSTETLVTLCRKGAEVVAAVVAVGAGLANVCWISRRRGREVFSTGHSGLIIINHRWGHMFATRASFHFEGQSFCSCYLLPKWRFEAAFCRFPTGSERPRRLKMFRPSFCIKPNYLFTCSSARARLPECKSKLLMLCARVPCSGGIICTPSGSAEKTFKHSCLKVLHDQQNIQKLCRPIMK